MRRLLITGLIALLSNQALAQTPLQLDSRDRQQLSELIAVELPHADPIEVETWLTVATPLIQPYVDTSDEQRRILHAIAKGAIAQQLPIDLVLAVIEVESHFNPYAISRAGALGLMQVMPFWIDEIGSPEDNLLEIETNITYGCSILKYYLDKHDGRWADALAAYNGSLGSNRYSNKVLNAWEQKWKYSRVDF